jgi:elongation factor 1-gamma
VFKALIAAQYNGAEVATTSDFKMGVDNKTPEFLALNPNGKVPTLETPEGAVWESNAIARYVARSAESNLFGSSIYENSLVDQWIEWSRGELELPGAAWLYPIMGFVPNNKQVRLALVVLSFTSFTG